MGGAGEDCAVEVAESEAEEGGGCESGFWLRVVEKTSEFSQSDLCLLMYTATCVHVHGWREKGRGRRRERRGKG